MATQLIATGNTAFDSADIVVAAGVPVMLSLKNYGHNAKAIVFAKDDAGSYWPVGELTTYEPAKTLGPPGTYRVSRVAGGACGAFSGG